MPKVNREKRMDVPAGMLARAILEFESYPEFLDEVVSATLQPGGTDTVQTVKFELEVIKKFSYTLQFDIKGKEEIAWKLVDGNFFKINDGKWVLKAVDDNSVDVTYELEIGFGFLVPGFIAKKLTEVNLPRMFDSYEERARKLAKG